MVQAKKVRRVTGRRQSLTLAMSAVSAWEYVSGCNYLLGCARFFCGDGWDKIVFMIKIPRCRYGT